MNVEQSLRALAADDTTARIPPHVDAAVMAAWDASCRAEQGRGRGRRTRAALVGAIAGACAASLVAIAVVTKSRAGDELSHARRDIAPQTSISSRVHETVAGTISRPDGAEQRRPPSRVRRSPVVPPQMDAAYVLVPDVEVNAPLTMMRVRMPRSAFSRLGVPIANPDGDGMVDVEMLVGEDGVARSIRRATAVGWTDANR